MIRKLMKRSYIAALALTFVMISCKDQEVFEKEMYKNVAALISSNDHNTFQELISLSGEEVTGYIAASIGGTHTSQHDIVIRLEEDDEPLARYNRSLFDEEVSLYAHSLPSDRYEIDDYNITIKSGERTGRTQIRLRADGLSPDSSYFIGLKVSEVEGGELNPNKGTILYQVLLSNPYASQNSDDYYAMTGTVDEMVTAANKKMFPLTSNSVRVIAGNETFESNLADINRTAMVLEINEDNRVSIKPYNDIVITQLDDDPRYPNSFKQETIYGRTFNVFSLSYAYTIDGVTKLMKEELRMQASNNNKKD